MAGRVVGLLAAMLVIAGGAGAWGQDVEKAPLSIGDQAPELEVSKWVKGEAVEGFEPGNIYVVEFWATWCGPCKTSIPHLTKLQEEYESRKVKFIGVSVWEESQEGVEPFVKEMGDEMNYRVAMDKIAEGKEADSGSMAQNWMMAAGENGIPTAFVVGKDGKVAWIGHPMSMDEPLSKIVAGEWDVAVAAKERKDAKELEQKTEAIFSKVVTAMRSDKPAEAIAAIDEAVKENPKLEASQLGYIKFDLLLQSGEEEKAVAYGKSLVEGAYSEEANILNTMAWGLIDPDRPEAASKPLLALALQAAEQASQLTEGKAPAVLDTLALAQFKNGDAVKACATQKKAVEILGDEELDPGIRERLKMYEEEVGKSKGK